MGTILDDSILYEQVGGVRIDETSGDWSFHEFKNADAFLKDFGKYEDSVEALQGIVMSNNVSISSQAGEQTAIIDNSQGGYDSTGTLKTKKFCCPQCGKMVDKLLKNGYCSQACAVSARAEKV